MYRAAELKRLARAYIASTGTPANTISVLICGPSNNRMVGGLLDGRDIRVSNAEALSDFFDREWPVTLPWPEDIARNGVKQAKATE